MQAPRDVEWQIIPKMSCRKPQQYFTTEVPADASGEDVVAAVASAAEMPTSAEMRVFVQDVDGCFIDIRELPSLPPGLLRILIIGQRPGIPRSSIQCM